MNHEQGNYMRCRPPDRPGVSARDMLLSLPMVIRRRRWVIVAIAVVALLVAALVSVATRVPFSSDKLRSKVSETLADQLDSEVEMKTLTLRIYPRLHAEGSGLTIRHKRRHDVPPLISVGKFDIDADLVGLWRGHVARLNLEGLDIQIPPHDDAADQDDPKPQDHSPSNTATPTIAAGTTD